MSAPKLTPLQMVQRAHAEAERSWNRLTLLIWEFERCRDYARLQVACDQMTDLEIDLTGDCTATTEAVRLKLAAAKGRKGKHLERWRRWAEYTYFGEGNP